LKKHDLRLHLDDFGTGYSSLSYLHRIPVEALKKSIGSSSPRWHRPRQPVDRAEHVSLARALDIQVIAEGVETPAQLETLPPSSSATRRGLPAGPSAGGGQRRRRCSSAGPSAGRSPVA